MALALPLVGAVMLAAASHASAQDTSTIIGHSVRGEPIEVGCIGSGSRTVLVIGGVHTGAEAITADLALGFALELWGRRIDVPAGLEVCVLPVLNVDGMAMGTHTNANDVDLNRNWPSDDWTSEAWHGSTGGVSGGDEPLSEPETRALYDYLDQLRPDAVIVWHCCGPLVEANEQSHAPEMAQAYARAAGFRYIDEWTLYPVPGDLMDAMERLGVPALDVEMANAEDTDLQDHLAGIAAVMDYLDAQ